LRKKIKLCPDNLTYQLALEKRIHPDILTKGENDMTAHLYLLTAEQFKDLHGMTKSEYRRR